MQRYFAGCKHLRHCSVCRRRRDELCALPSVRGVQRSSAQSHVCENGLGVGPDLNGCLQAPHGDTEALWTRRKSCKHGMMMMTMGIELLHQTAVRRFMIIADRSCSLNVLVCLFPAISASSALLGRVRCLCYSCYGKTDEQEKSSLHE